MFSAEADLFFEPPNTRPNTTGQYGILHLLRKDIFLCMGYDLVNKKPVSHVTLWPGTMAILAGIDLLAKFYAGDDNPKQVGKRFQLFITKFFQLSSPGDEETIYQLRNAMLHSFGLYSRGKTREYHFTLGQHLPQFIIYSGDVCAIDIISLHKQFENAVVAFQTAVDSDSVLQKHFNLIFPNYGAITMTKKDVRLDASKFGTAKP